MLLTTLGTAVIFDWLYFVRPFHSLAAGHPFGAAFTTVTVVSTCVAAAFAHLERLRPRGRSVLRYTALLLPLWIFFMTGIQDSGHMTGVMREGFAVFGGALFGTLLGMWLQQKSGRFEA